MSSKKGGKAERQVAKMLGDWVGCEMVRVPRSGGLRWQSGLMVTGDVIPSDPQMLAEFVFSIEVKFHAEVDFSHLILPSRVKSVDILKFWAQACEDAKRVNKKPLLLFRYNFLPRDFFFVGMKWDHFFRVKRHMSFESSYFIYGRKLAIFGIQDLFSINYEFLSSLLCRIE